MANGKWQMATRPRREARRDIKSSVRSPTVSRVDEGAPVARRISAWTRASSSGNAKGFVR
jgi:hypothetical protein